MKSLSNYLDNETDYTYINIDTGVSFFLDPRVGWERDKSIARTRSGRQKIIAAPILDDSTLLSVPRMSCAGYSRQERNQKRRKKTTRLGQTQNTIAFLITPCTQPVDLFLGFFFFFFWSFLSGISSIFYFVSFTEQLESSYFDSQVKGQSLLTSFKSRALWSNRLKVISPVVYP